MPLNLNTGGSGDFLPYVKYNAKAGRWYVKDDNDDEVEVSDLTAIFDLEHIQTGWLTFNAAGIPEWAPDHDLKNPAPKPGDKAKRGFKVHCFAKKIGGARELMSNSMIANSAINQVYAEYEKAAENGKVPVIKCTGVNPITGKHGTNYEPILEIVKWVDRPSAENLPILGNGTVTAGSVDEDEPADDEEF
jgi:hypothetical protein